MATLVRLGEVTEKTTKTESNGTKYQVKFTHSPDHPFLLTLAEELVADGDVIIYFLDSEDLCKEDPPYIAPVAKIDCSWKSASREQLALYCTVQSIEANPFWQIQQYWVTAITRTKTAFVVELNTAERLRLSLLEREGGIRVGDIVVHISSSLYSYTGRIEPYLEKLHVKFNLIPLTLA